MSKLGRSISHAAVPRLKNSCSLRAANDSFEDAWLPSGPEAAIWKVVALVKTSVTKELELTPVLTLLEKKHW